MRLALELRPEDFNGFEAVEPDAQIDAAWGAVVLEHSACAFGLFDGARLVAAAGVARNGVAWCVLDRRAPPRAMLPFLRIAARMDIPPQAAYIREGWREGARVARAFRLAPSGHVEEVDGRRYELWQASGTKVKA